MHINEGRHRTASAADAASALLYGGFAASMRTALFWAKYGGKPIVLTDKLDFYSQPNRAYHDEAAKHGRASSPATRRPGAASSICAPTDAEAHAQPRGHAVVLGPAPLFGQGLPELLVGSPDTIHVGWRRFRRLCPARMRLCCWFRRVCMIAARYCDRWS